MDRIINTSTNFVCIKILRACARHMQSRLRATKTQTRKQHLLFDLVNLGLLCTLGHPRMRQHLLGSHDI